jgi:hypothetical protein
MQDSIRRITWMFIVVAMMSVHVHAGIVWDYSPQASGTVSTNILINRSAEQNFAERVIFSASTQIFGMDIYMSEDFPQPPAVGDQGRIRLWSELNGEPDSLIATFTELVAIVDSEGAVLGNTRVYVDFSTPLVLDAGVAYWIGMSHEPAGNVIPHWTQTGLMDPGAPGDSRMYQFDGTIKIGFTGTNLGDMAFRLHGTSLATVPEPTSIVMFGMGALMFFFGCVIRSRGVTANVSPAFHSGKSLPCPAEQIPGLRVATGGGVGAEDNRQ